MDHLCAPSTIAAIATPPGEGGVAIIRICGPQAIAITAKIFSGPVHTYLSHTAHLGKIRNLQGDIIDEGLILIMRAPRSYTGEDTVEIHCHGGSLITRDVLDATFQAGAIAAGPGEFTFRAFRNGKIDLAQAEAVQQLIGAKNTLAINAAKAQLQGRLSNAITHFQQELIACAAILEAWVDFPEDDLEFASEEEMLLRLTNIKHKMSALSGSFHEGRKIHHGLSLCLSGPPNVGKSSLMNALLGKERAIVTEIAGTTRDLIEEEMRLGALHLRLIDTAGIRDTEEIIEQEGIRRSKEAMQSADLILLVFDATHALSEEFKTLLTNVPQHKTLLIWNKIDLLEPADYPDRLLPHVAYVSAKTGDGLDQFRETLNTMIWQNGMPEKGEIVITNARHHQALEDAIQATTEVIEGIKSKTSPELIVQDVKQALTELGKIVGMDITEEILSAIFSTFCIGK